MRRHCKSKTYNACDMSKIWQKINTVSTVQVIELSKQQEISRQQEFKAKEAQYQAAAQQAAIVSSVNPLP